MLTSRALRIALATAVAAALAAPLVLRAQGFRDNTGITVYDDINFKGKALTIDRDVPDLRGFGFDRQVSSFRFGSGAWEVCSERNYAGRCKVFTSSSSDLRRSDWNDEIRSLRRVRDDRRDDRGDNQDRRFGVVPPGSLELYSGPNFAGQRVVLKDNAPDFRRFNFNDRALSLRAVSGESWEVCANINFDDCRVVDGELPNLARVGLAGISSARPRNRGWNLRPANTIELYAGMDFSGDVRVINTANPDLKRDNFNDRALSIRIPRGQQWEVCVNIKYDDCRVLDRDVRDLAAIGLGRNISSVRVHVGR